MKQQHIKATMPNPTESQLSPFNRKKGIGQEKSGSSGFCVLIDFKS